MLSQALWIALKDIRLDWRTRREVVGLITLGVVCLLIFGLAFSGGQGAQKPTTAVLFLPYWVTVLFLLLLSTLWIFERERQNGTLSALILGCKDTSSIFIGKCIAYFVRHAVIQSVLMLLFLTFNNKMTIETLGWFAVLNLLVTVAFTALGVLTSAMLTQSGVTGSLGGVLLFPLLIPVILAAVAAMEDSTLMTSTGFNNWVELLVAGDILFVAFPIVIFDKIIEG